MLSADLNTFVICAMEYGEEEVAERAKTCTIEQQRDMCIVAEWLEYHLPANGGKRDRADLAEASAAVFVLEGHPRELALKRPRAVDVPEFENGDRMLELGEEDEFDDADFTRVITGELKDFWLPRVGLDSATTELVGDSEC